MPARCYGLTAENIVERVVKALPPRRVAGKAVGAP